MNGNIQSINRKMIIEKKYDESTLYRIGKHNYIFVDNDNFINQGIMEEKFNGEPYLQFNRLG